MIVRWRGAQRRDQNPGVLLTHVGREGRSSSGLGSLVGGGKGRGGVEAKDPPRKSSVIICAYISA